MKQLLSHFALSLIASATLASTWHVSPTPLSSVPANRQFRTIQDAAKIASAGDTVLTHSGVYRETVTIEKSGTQKRPIRFEAMPAANVIVTGLDQLTDWRKENGENVYSTAWPFRFIAGSKTDAYPDDEYHRLIGRAEQVVMNDQLLKQTLERDRLSPGSFYVDLTNKRLYVSPAAGETMDAKSLKIEAATRSTLWQCKGDYVTIRGIRFAYAANPAQQGGAIFQGRGDVAEDCTFERMNGSGAAFLGPDQVARRCVFQDNGQLGFGAAGAHGLLISDCAIRNNNTKGFNKQWEAGGDKIVLSRGVVLEKNRFVGNHGCGVWFDTGDENSAVRNCLIADNEDAGIFYEASYGLQAHDNVIVGNGFATTPHAWGGQAGVVLSSSPNCVVERNLLVGNREGFNFREQSRTTARIDKPDAKQEESIWNHAERISNNVIAYNRDVQTRGWFDVNDDRHWPRKSQTTGSTMSLETLRIVMTQNVYAREGNQWLFAWGTDWKRHLTYSTIPEIQSDLHLEEGSRLLPVPFRNYAARDFRIRAGSAILRTKCYPQGDVPDVILGAFK